MAFDAIAPALLESCSQLLHLKDAGRWLLVRTHMSIYSHHMLGHCRVCPTRCTTAEQASSGTSQSALSAWRSTSRYIQCYIIAQLSSDVQAPCDNFTSQYLLGQCSMFAAGYSILHLCWSIYMSATAEARATLTF